MVLAAAANRSQRKDTQAAVFPALQTAQDPLCAPLKSN